MRIFTAWELIASQRLILTVDFVNVSDPLHKNNL